MMILDSHNIRIAGRNHNWLEYPYQLKPTTYSCSTYRHWYERESAGTSLQAPPSAIWDVPLKLAEFQSRRGHFTHFSGCPFGFNRSDRRKRNGSYRLNWEFSWENGGGIKKGKVARAFSDLSQLETGRLRNWLSCGAERVYQQWSYKHDELRLHYAHSPLSNHSNHNITPAHFWSVSVVSQCTMKIGEYGIIVALLREGNRWIGNTIRTFNIIILQTKTIKSVSPNRTNNRNPYFNVRRLTN